MNTFKDLKFQPHTTGEGLMGRLFFSNGYGISVVRFAMPHLGFSSVMRYGSYTDNENEWEVAILDSKGNLIYDTPITDDVIGHCTEEKVTEIMKQIQELKTKPA